MDNVAKKAEKFKTQISKWLIFACASAVVWIILNEPLLETFLPRTVTMSNDHLVILHVIGNGIAAVASLILAFLLFKLYKNLHTKRVPVLGIGYAWIFAGFFLACGLSRVIEVINIWITYYWIDAIIKLFVAFTLSACTLALMDGYKDLLNTKSPEEYQNLLDKIKELEDLQKKVNDV